MLLASCITMFALGQQPPALCSASQCNALPDNQQYAAFPASDPAVKFNEYTTHMQIDGAPMYWCDPSQSQSSADNTYNDAYKCRCRNSNNECRRLTQSICPPDFSLCDAPVQDDTHLWLIAALASVGGVLACAVVLV